jgi:hypothetical protein
MKTSNKILLGIFLAIIILTATVQLMVFAKYKRGEYVAFQRDKIIKVASVSLPAARLVALKNLGSCVLINSDTLRFETDKDKVNNISYRVLNDTLIIQCDTTLTADQLQRWVRSYQMVKIYIPAAVQVNAISCDLFIDGAVDSVKAPSYYIQLSKRSQLNIREKHGVTSYFNRLLINSDQSAISLNNKVIVSDMNLTLALGSRMDYTEATFRKLTLDMDNNSTITLSGMNYKALK